MFVFSFRAVGVCRAVCCLLNAWCGCMMYTMKDDVLCNRRIMINYNDHSSGDAGLCGGYEAVGF